MNYEASRFHKVPATFAAFLAAMALIGCGEENHKRQKISPPEVRKGDFRPPKHNNNSSHTLSSHQNKDSDNSGLSRDNRPSRYVDVDFDNVKISDVKFPGDGTREYFLDGAHGTLANGPTMDSCGDGESNYGKYQVFHNGRFFRYLTAIHYPAHACDDLMLTPNDYKEKPESSG